MNGHYFQPAFKSPSTMTSYLDFYSSISCSSVQDLRCNHIYAPIRPTTRLQFFLISYYCTSQNYCPNYMNGNLSWSLHPCSLFSVVLCNALCAKTILQITQAPILRSFEKLGEIALNCMLCQISDFQLVLLTSISW